MKYRAERSQDLKNEKYKEKNGESKEEINASMEEINVSDIEKYGRRKRKKKRTNLTDFSVIL